MTSSGAEQPRSIVGRWNAIPLYLRIVIAMIAVAVAGLVLGQRALVLEIPSKVILQLLGALAPPLILVAVTHVLMTTDVRGKTALRLVGLLLLNTMVAITVGLTVANVMRPGKWSKFEAPQQVETKEGGDRTPSNCWSRMCLRAFSARSVTGRISSG